MIKLNDDYKIDFDSMNVTLYKRIQRTDKAKNPNEEKFGAIGYFGSFEHLIDKLLNDKIFHNNFNNFEEIKKEISSFKKDILNKIIELKPNTKPYKYKLESDE